MNASLLMLIPKVLIDEYGPILIDRTLRTNDLLTSVEAGDGTENGLAYRKSIRNLLRTQSRARERSTSLLLYLRDSEGRDQAFPLGNLAPALINTPKSLDRDAYPLLF